MAETAVARHQLGIALACRGFGAGETCDLDRPVRKDENEEIADLLARLTDARKIWAFGLCFQHSRKVKGCPWNHKCVYLI